MSGVKSKVERLCQSFETGGDIDLSEHHPNVISNVLKLYLRQVQITPVYDSHVARDLDVYGWLLLLCSCQSRC